MLAACDTSGGGGDDEEEESIVSADYIGEIELTNADFESSTESNGWIEPTGWDVSIFTGDTWGEYGVQTDNGASNNTSYHLHLTSKADSMDATATQTVILPKGNYTATIQVAGSGTVDLVFSAVSGDTILASDDSITLSAWDTWTTYTINFALDATASVTLGITGTMANSSYCEIDNLTLEKTAEAESE